MVKQNIGTLNALARITCGLTFLTIEGVKMARKKDDGSAFMLAMSAMKVAEGIVRYCPVTDMVSRMVDDENSNSDSQMIADAVNEFSNN